MKKKRKGRVADALFDLCDDHHAFIAGYTEGGFAYGVTWEQAAEREATTEAGTRLDEEHEADLESDDASEPFDDRGEWSPADRTDDVPADDDIPF